MSIAAVFPGQGSQRVGMAQDFHSHCQVAKEVFAQASEALQMDMAELCFTDNQRLDLTQYTQPAILTAEIAMYRSLQELYGLQADYFAGHSLGEYSALVACGALPLFDAVQIVHKRGELMQSACPAGKGAMAALIHDDIASTSYKEIVHEHNAQIANINAKDQVVISGYIEAIEQAVLSLEKKIEQIKCVRLNVSAPFHCSIMQGIEKEFGAFLQKYAENFQASYCSKVLSNYTGEFYSKEHWQSNLIKQLSSPVLWIKNMENLIAFGADTIYEIGPNRPLTKFFASLSFDSDKLNVHPLLNLRSAKRLFASS